MIGIENESEMAPQKEARAKKVFVVLNPVAGLTDADDARQLIVQACEDIGWECEIHETCPEDDLYQIVQDAISREVELVIAAGGDGTVSGVVSGMVNSHKPMAILPAGTGNALARDLGIPLNLQEALGVLRGPNRTCTLDVMKVNDDYYVLNVSIGISSKVMENTGREQKRRFGMLAYLWNAIGTILRSDMHRFEARVDGRPYRFMATEVMITNTRLLGMDMSVDGVTIDGSDGRLDLFILRARTFRDYLSLLFKIIFRGRRNGDHRLRYLEIKDKAELRSTVPLTVQADGEEIGHTPVDLLLIPGSLDILVPVKEDGPAKTD